MAVGDSTWSIQTGGGSTRATSAQLARAVVHLGMSPLLTPNTLLQVGNDTGSLLAALDYCPLSELAAFTGRNALIKYVMALNPTNAGALASATAQTGTGTGTCVFASAPHKLITVKCILGGVIGTATFAFSLDGGVTYGPTITSVAAAPWLYMVPGTFCTLSFAAATYVATKTLTVTTTGVVTPGSGWVGTVTQTSSPLDNYEPVVSIQAGGALATAVVGISMDNGNSTEIGSFLTPSSGIFAIPNTGIYVTMSGTFTKGDTYSTLATPPSPTTSDITNAMNAIMAVRTVAATLIHLSVMPSTAAGAFSAASTLETSIETAQSSFGFDWQGICDCPSPKGGTRMSSPITGRKLQRGGSWFWVDAYVDTDPKMELAAKAAQGDRQQGSFRAFIPAGSTSIAGLGDLVVSAGNTIRDAADTDSTITGARGADLIRTAVCVSGRDEFLNPGLDAAQINTFRTYNGPLAVYGTITSGTAGFKMLSTNSSYADGAAVRVLDVLVAGLRPLAQDELGQDYATNPDGTIASSAKKILDTKFDTAAKLLLGMLPGGDFAQPQASLVTAQILSTSQLGTAPKRLDIAYQLQPRGKVTNVNNIVAFAGTLTVTQ
jgi:hypothetical protein